MIRFFVLISFVFLSNVSFAQDSQLAKGVVSKCEVLSELAKGGKVYSDSAELYTELQKLDSETGGLLIENCSDDILNFTSKFCSSSGNKDLCGRVGISKVDYKSFGVSALPQFSLNNNLPKVEYSYEFNAAGFLFLLSPVSKLKFVKPVSKALATRARPLLSGAMLVLSSLGLASCDDLAGPQVICVGEQFKLIGFRSEACIDLPKVSKVEYLDASGSAVSKDSVTDQKIKISFDSEVGYIDFEGWQKLSDSNASNVFSIETLPKDFGTYTVSEVGGKSVITFTPNTSYPTGNYKINLQNLAKRSDASAILSSNNKAEYLSKIQDSTHNFTAIGGVSTPCTRGETGYFELTLTGGTTDCIKLPVATISLIDSNGNVTTSTTNITNHKVGVQFDEAVGWLSSSGYRALTSGNLFNVLEILNSQNQNLLTNNFAHTLNISSNDQGTYFEFTPTNNYPQGSYEVKVKSFATSQDATNINLATNKTTYLTRIETTKDFTTTGVISTPCTRGETGYFELTLSGGIKECIKLPVATISLIDSDGNVTTDTTNITNHKVGVQFDEAVGWLSSSGYRALTSGNLSNVLEILNSQNQNLLTNNFAHTLNISSNDQGTYFEFTPTNNYPQGNYEIKVKSFATSQDATNINLATNKTTYLTRIETTKDFTASSVVSTPCTRGETGYFELTLSGGIKECIKLPVATISLIDSDGNVTTDATNITNHKVGVQFDEAVGWLSSSGYRALTSSNLSNVLEILNSQSQNLLTNNFAHTLNISSNDQGTYFEFTPTNNYPQGSYEVKVKSFATSQDATNINLATNKTTYLTRIEAKKNFTAGTTNTTCDSSDYEATDTNNNKVCLKVPNATWKFQPYLGRYIDLPTGDNFTSIKISFDKEISYISGSGTLVDLSTTNVLEMLEMISDNGGLNIVGSGNFIDTDQISITQTSAKTDIIIDPPDGEEGYDQVTRQGGESFNLRFKNYAVKSDASKFTNLHHNVIEDFKNTTKLEKTGFWTGHEYGSCITRPDNISGYQSDNQDSPDGWCRTDTSTSPDFSFDMHTMDRSKFGLANDRADPNITYQIDIAFIVSAGALASGLTDSFIRTKVVPHMNGIFEDSGVNVRFNVVAINAYSSLKQHLVCSRSLDGKLPGEGLEIMKELAPKMQKDYNADLVYGLFNVGETGTCGMAELRRGGDQDRPIHRLARWFSVGIVDINCGGSYTNRLEGEKKHHFIEVLAHEIGHNLGLSHDGGTLSEVGAPYPDPENFHAEGYGYVSNITHGEDIHPYGTIMSYIPGTHSVPFFSTSDSNKVSNICTGDGTRFDYEYDSGFCESISPVLSKIVDLDMPLGGGSNPTVDASEALQYSIEDASNYTIPPTSSVIAEGRNE